MSRSILLSLALSASLASAAEADVQNGLYLPIDDVTVFDVSGAQVTLNGSAVIGAPQVDFQVDAASMVDDFLLEGGLTLDVSADVSGPFTHTLSLPVTTLPTLNFGPSVTVVPIVTIGAEISGVAEAGMEIGLVQRFAINPHLSIGASMTTSLGDVPSFLGDVSAPVVSGNTGVDLNVEVETGLVFLVTFNGVPLGGPVLESAFGIDVAVSPDGNPWFDADGYLKVDASATIAGISLPEQTLHETRRDIVDGGGPFLPQVTSRWAHAFDLDNTEDATAIVPLRDGGAYVVGNGAGPINNGWVARLDASGSPIWERHSLVLPNGGSRPVDAFETEDGGLVVGGLYGINGTARAEKIDENGNLEWSKVYSDVLGGTLRLDSIAPRNDGGFVFAGRITRSGVKSPAVVFLDERGDLERALELDVLSETTDASFAKVLPLDDGGVILAGRMVWEDTPVFVDQTMSQANGLLCRLDAAGRIEWATLIGTKGTGEILDADLLEDGSIVVCGEQAEASDGWVATVSADGTLDWSAQLGGDPESLFDRLTSVSAVLGGGFVVGGTTGIGGNTDVWLFRLTRRGLPLWHKSIRSAAYDELVDVRVVDGGLVACGRTDAAGAAPGGAVGDLWCLRTTVDGMLHFSGASGLDAANDDVIWGATETVKQVDVPNAAIVVLQVLQTADQLVVQPVTSTVIEQL